MSASPPDLGAIGDAVGRHREALDNLVRILNNHSGLMPEHVESLPDSELEMIMWHVKGAALPARVAAATVVLRRRLDRMGPDGPAGLIHHLTWGVLEDLERGGADEQEAALAMVRAGMPAWDDWEPEPERTDT